MKRLTSVHPASAACLAMLLAACALPAPRSTPSRAGKPHPATPAAAARPGASRDVLGEEEIRAANAVDAYDLIQKLRPAWLRQKPGPSEMDADGSREIRVWVNGRDAGGPGVLRNYDPERIVTIRWVDPTRARVTYGAGYGRGVVELQTR
ncbi:MAG TPA: hypothetical protein VK358_08100 [Longimicrobium sp.]|nr:hypothetical protein [Longimicrobium sp.]